MNCGNGKARKLYDPRKGTSERQGLRQPIVARLSSHHPMPSGSLGAEKISYGSKNVGSYSASSRQHGLIMGFPTQRLRWRRDKWPSVPPAGAQLAFTYQGDALKKRVRSRRKSALSRWALQCNRSCNDRRSDRALRSACGCIHFLVHAIAFSDRAQLDGRYVDTTQDNFTQTMLVSCYSFTSVAQRAEKMMPNGGPC